RMKKIDILSPVDVRDIVINELRKRDKIISKLQFREIIKQEVMKFNKDIYRQLDKLRGKINEK
ncbi:MAG: hypothetical protein ACTSW3_07180, partial [Promethearchaeota archaeon]